MPTAASADPAAPLAGVGVVSLAVNLPGPLAAARLAGLGAAVVKVEPPSGDPLAAVSPGWHSALCRGQEVLTLDLKDPAGLRVLHDRLAGADLLLTSSRPGALARLGLAFAELHARHPRLCQVRVVGHPGPGAEQAGHDLTYQAAVGILAAPAMPLVPVVDVAGAERATAEALAALLHRERTGEATCREVALSEVAHGLAEAARRGLTGPGGVLGGALPTYGLYAAADGHVALAALEPHFRARVCEELGVDGSRESFAAAFAARTAQEWQQWAEGRDVPLAAVRDRPR